MDLIRHTVESGKAVYGNTAHELLAALDYYYDRDHVKAAMLASLLLQMDLSQHERTAVEIKLCVSAYYAGLFGLGRKIAEKHRKLQPENEIYKRNVAAFNAYFQQHFDYCLFIWPQTYKHLADAAKGLKWKLEREGSNVILSESIIPSAEKTVVFGAFLSHSIPVSIPENSIIYNLEILYDGCSSDHPVFLDMIKDKEIWDYSAHNIEWLKRRGLGKNHLHMKIGYSPNLLINREILRQPVIEDIDILFIGAPNQRRNLLEQQLKELAPDLKIVFINGIWGPAKDEYILRSKILLNIHYLDSTEVESPLETARIAQYIANGKFVISEHSCRDEEQEWPGIVFTDYENLAETAVTYAHLPEERNSFAELGRRYFTESYN
ncbi:glycosyltransferase family 1 protein [Bacillus lacus]|uniref:Glycosyltransferase family 1 protein n=1 Tax=Metabacillus lacus TaxID=1983721 RepID=A0A7X2IYX3_9BACI|nr:glycosyltransferase family 1 protein [Metabacillus lacus]MRX72348.1 glycosyltransferase family 1 protein [Metabacillus lacus]